MANIDSEALNAIRDYEAVMKAKKMNSSSSFDDINFSRPSTSNENGHVQNYQSSQVASAASSLHERYYSQKS